MSQLTPIKITVLFADDHPLAREGIRKLLTQTDDLEISKKGKHKMEIKKLALVLILLILQRKVESVKTG